MFNKPLTRDDLRGKIHSGFGTGLTFHFPRYNLPNKHYVCESYLKYSHCQAAPVDKLQIRGIVRPLSTPR